ncbi:hypothetical protein JTB14_019065 [Gonioctena quinquepunctata]|nr:hypothetical protein JTB14_019065 [Gonioctena quinquepunctata]
MKIIQREQEQQIKELTKLNIELQRDVININRDIYAFFLNNRGYSKLEIERELKHVNNYLASKISDLNRLPRVKKTNPTLDIIGNEEVSDDQVRLAVQLVEEEEVKINI